MKKALFVIAFLLTGCAPIRVTVYGKGGTAYAAPDLCAAILACQKAGETACMYTDVDQIDAQGNKFETRCKVLPTQPKERK